MYDINKIRKDFPMLNNKIKMQGKPLIYLDNASTTFKPQSVIDAVVKYYSEMTANSHRGDYDLLYNMDQEVLKTRESISKFINSDVNEVVFTSGDTASLNLIANGYAKFILKPGDEILLSFGEHASNVLPWYQICKETKAIVKFIPLDEKGRILPKNVAKVLSNKTKIISIAHISNVLGYETNIKEIAKLAHKNNAIIVVDGAQSVPHISTDFKSLDIDFLTFSAHKMCGPTGVGALIGKFNLLCEMNTYLTGGGMNVTFDEKMNFEPFNPPFKFEAGTLPLAEICGFRAAIDYLNKIGMENIHKHDVELTKYAINELKKNPNVIIYNDDSNGSIITFNIKNIFAQDEATLLNSKGICVRSGEHCAKLLDRQTGIKATCRMSTYLYTSKEEIDCFIDAINNGGDILDAYFSN